MKKRTVSGFMTAVLLSLLLSGCQKDVKQEAVLPKESLAKDISPPESSVETETSMQEESSTQEEAAISVPKLQFVKEYGIIQSEYPVDTLDMEAISELTQGEVTIRPVLIMYHNQQLIVTLVLDDHSERKRMEAGEETSEDGRFFELSDGTKVASERYRIDIWNDGEGINLTGPDIPKDGYQPNEAYYASHKKYYEKYGVMRHFIDATFELPIALDFENHPSDYAFRILDIELPLNFTMKRAVGYETIEELAAGEQGSLDTKDGYSLIFIGDKSEDGISISGYAHSESGDRPGHMSYTPSMQESTMPILSSGEAQYPLRFGHIDSRADALGAIFRLTGVNVDGRCSRYLYDVPREEQDKPFSVTVPGITFKTGEQSPEITLRIPEDTEELTEQFSLREGVVRLLKITKLKEPQTVGEWDGEKTVTKITDRPAVYVHVEAVSEEKEVALKGLICKRKLERGGWENQRYDFNEDGNLSGFRIFYDEGDTEITLQFDSPAIYWKQAFEMELPVVSE